MHNLTGCGPSKVQVVSDINNIKFVRKIFADDEKDRMTREIVKMTDLSKIFYNSHFVNVPEIYAIGKNYYDMQYIKNAVELNDFGHVYQPEIIAKKLTIICDTIKGYRIAHGNLWKCMLKKFNQLETDHIKYLELISNLPREYTFDFNCYGFAHGDLTFDNILVDVNSGLWYLIDPAWSEVESPLWDVGKLMQSVLINWQEIKRKGNDFDTMNWTNHIPLLSEFIKIYGAKAVYIASACQFVRVARWCHKDIMTDYSCAMLEKFYESSN